MKKKKLLSFLASSKGHLEIVQYLIKNGALIDAKSRDGETALDIARENGHRDIVEYLESKHASE